MRSSILPVRAGNVMAATMPIMPRVIRTSARVKACLLCVGIATSRCSSQWQNIPSFRPTSRNLLMLVWVPNVWYKPLRVLFSVPPPPRRCAHSLNFHNFAPFLFLLLYKKRPYANALPRFYNYLSSLISFHNPAFVDNSTVYRLLLKRCSP